VPFFLSNRETQVSQDIFRLATAVAGERAAMNEDEPRKVVQKKSLFSFR
jgi:hypothetical protein